MAHNILIINPGSTSTKVGIARESEPVESETIHHSPEELHHDKGIWGQFDFRLQLVRQWAIPRLDTCSAVVARGGLLRPIDGGVYRVNGAMVDHARANLQGEHAANLGCAMAFELAMEYCCSAFVIDPVSVDEFEPLARYSGYPTIERRSLSHALSIHAAGRRAAEELRIKFEESHFIVCHIGGGISVAPLSGGKIIDVNDANSDGPFSPERTGGLPLQQFITLCCSGTYSQEQLRSLVNGKGGLYAYLGTNDIREVERRISTGDVTAREVLEAMAYQVAKEIGAMTTVLHGNVDAIVLTGGGAYSTLLTLWIEERVQFIAKVKVYPGEDEMTALAGGALRALCGEERVKAY